MTGFFALVMVAAASLAACSDVKSIVGLEEEGAQTLAVSAESTTVPPGGSTTIRFQVTGKDGLPAKDGTEVEVTGLRLGRVESSKLWTHSGSGSVATIYRAPSSPGSDRLEAKSGDARASLSLTIAESAPSATAPGGGSGGGSNGSSIDLRTVSWLHADVSGWAETSRITSVSIGDPPICIEHTKAGEWPVKDGLEGNPWIFVNLDGRWYAATYEWLSPGQTCKGIDAGNIGPHIGVPPLASWRPRSGELVGLMVSARARSGGDTVSERSNVVMTRWP